MLLDLHLPDIHGFDVCERLKSSCATRDIPIVHISATGRGDRFRRESIAAGAAAFLQEPVEPDYLVRLVRTVLKTSNRPKQRRRNKERG